MDNRKLLQQCNENPKNIRFEDFVGLVKSFGFSLSRISGSHHIFKHKEIVEFINIQNVDGKAKPYQIRQFLKIIKENHLEVEEHL